MLFADLKHIFFIFEKEKGCQRIAGSIIPAVVSNYSKLELAYLGVRLASMTFKMFKKLRRK